MFEEDGKMKIWTGRSGTDNRRLRAAAEHTGVSVFADVRQREVLLAVLYVALSALRLRKRRRGTGRQVAKRKKAP